MFLSSLNIAGSALTAEQYRLNLISQNIANAETTRTESGGPYKRKTPIYKKVSDNSYSSYNSYGARANPNFATYVGYANSLSKYRNNANSAGNLTYTSSAVYVKSALKGNELNGVKTQTQSNVGTGKVSNKVSNVNNKYVFGRNNINLNGGVKITKVIEDPTPGKIVYDPEHPDADENGYVEMPNVDMVQEMVDMMGASRSYEANVQVVNAMKAMALRAIDIGR